MSMSAVGRKRAVVSGKCSRRRCHGKRGTCWVEVCGWVDILKSSSTGWIACWLGFGMTSENSSIKRLRDNWVLCIGYEDGAGLVVAAGGDTLLV